jgi:alkaline phosphatase D
VEFVTTSVTSPGPDGTVDELREREAAMVRDRPHLRYVNLRQQGYLLLDLDPERAQGEWWYVDSIARRDAAAAFGTGLATARGSNHLVRVDTPSKSNGERPELA